jgi:uncharacterized metal-binding protein YceD (DUF177 family)
MSKKYVLKFSGLSNGIHEFEYTINKDLFEEFDCEEVLGADLSMKVNLDKSERQLILDFHIQGVLQVICDRCGEEMDLNMEFERRLYVEFGEEFEEQDVDLYVIPFNEYSLDLSPFVYEYVTLERPMRCVHGETEGNNQECNKEIIEILESPMEEVEKETDSRWDALKNLKF